MRLIHLLLGTSALAFILLTGCRMPPIEGNPSFTLSRQEALLALKAMRAEPYTLQRPVVVLGGYADPGFVAGAVARRLREVLEPSREIIAISFLDALTFESCREKVIRRVDARFPTDDPIFTQPVDVVAVSMGGLVARHAARDLGGRRLNINRLFTIASPHTGAKLAALPTFDKRQLAMRIDSDFLAALNDDPDSLDFPIFAYVRLEDAIVGVDHAAPPGMTPWWVPNEPASFAHIGAADDPRLLADIARRLREEPPFATHPAAPPPDPNEPRP